MADMVDEKFREWTSGKDAVQARISIYQKIRDIPYAVIPELNDAERYVDILRLGKGSCTPKHFLLGNMFQRPDGLIRGLPLPVGRLCNLLPAPTRAAG